jgi:hypothetical protein
LCYIAASAAIAASSVTLPSCYACYKKVPFTCRAEKRLQKRLNQTTVPCVGAPVDVAIGAITSAGIRQGGVDAGFGGRPFISVVQIGGNGSRCAAEV